MEKMSLTALEDTLAADPLGKANHACQQRLQDALASLLQAHRLSLDPETHDLLERQRVACMAAMRVIEEVWRRQHCT